MLTNLVLSSIQPSTTPTPIVLVLYLVAYWDYLEILNINDP